MMEDLVNLFENTVFFPPDSEIQLKYWQDDEIWGVIKSYPPSIRDGFKILKETTHLYIANGYSDQIKSSNRHKDCGPRKKGQPPRNIHVIAGLGEQIAPARRRRLHPKTEKRQPRFDQDRPGDPKGGAD